MRYPCFLLALTLAMTAPASAQTIPSSDPGSSAMTRVELERLLGEYEAALSSSAYSAKEKQGIRADVDQIRARLERGDLRIGDRILLSVQGEANLPDTVTVQPGPMILLPVFGEIPVAGVLRSELTDHLTDALSGFIRDPVVRVIPLMRISVLGAVGRPGFYTMPAVTVISEALMVAGGPSARANLDKVAIERGSEEIMDGDAVQNALREGLTLDQLNLRPGDEIFVPDRGSLLNNLRLATAIVGSVSFLIWRIVG